MIFFCVLAREDGTCCRPNDWVYALARACAVRYGQHVCRQLPHVTHFTCNRFGHVLLTTIDSDGEGQRDDSAAGRSFIKPPEPNRGSHTTIQGYSTSRMLTPRPVPNRWKESVPPVLLSVLGHQHRREKARPRVERY